MSPSQLSSFLSYSQSDLSAMHHFYLVHLLGRAEINILYQVQDTKYLVLPLLKV